MMPRRDPKKGRPRSLAKTVASGGKTMRQQGVPTPAASQAARRIPKIQEPAERGGFLPASQQRLRHADLQFRRRGELHVLLGAVHRAVNRGRVDLAGFFARSAARLVDEGRRADA